MMNVVVRESPIHGVGVFATRRINAGEVITNARGTAAGDAAIRVIEAGEEVTVDYLAEQVPGLRLECNCRAPNCRGLLVGPDVRI